MRYYLSAFALVTLASLSTLRIQAQSLEEQIEAAFPYFENIYRQLHEHPELSFQEEKTAKKLAEELKKSGFRVETNIGGHGIVGVLENGKGPTVLVRADMDALPVAEQTGLPYASQARALLNGNEVGVMHACGHDLHMAVFLGTANILAKNKTQWSGTLVFVGQPAEERASGARAMLRDELYERFPVPDYALALHTNAGLESGKVGLSSGYMLANVDMVDITVFGQGGHGAYPHTTVDPIVLSARIILDLQTIVSREISPLEPAVVTVGSIHGGNKGNVIPDEVKLELTLRSYSREVREAMLQKMKRMLAGIALSAGLPEERYPTLHIRDESTPALYNDPALTERIKKAFVSRLDSENVVNLKPVMGGEDFSEFGRTQEEVPIFLYWLGTVAPQKIEAAERGEISLPSLHSPFYSPDVERSLKTGMNSMVTAVLELAGK